MRKIYILLFFLLLFFKTAYAQQYFDFNLNKKYVYQDRELEVQFLYDFEGYTEENFIVRPKIDRGSIEIYDPTKNIWINHSDLWTNMPNLAKNMKVRPSLVGKSEIFFEIQNTTDAKIYETGKKTIWGGNIFGNYIEKINKNIFSYNTNEEKTPTPLPSQVSTEEKPPGLFAKMIKYIDGII